MGGGLIIMTRLKTFKNFVENLATLSKCTKRGVAAIIVDQELTQVLSIGVNGGAKGGDQCLCELPSKYGCLHAEQNALIKCQVPTEGKVMICTLEPCIQCAAAIINAGIVKFYYTARWKDGAGLIMLTAAGVQCIYLE